MMFFGNLDSRSSVDCAAADYVKAKTANKKTGTFEKKRSILFSSTLIKKNTQHSIMGIRIPMYLRLPATA
jgi:hypothetical protein